MCNAYKIKIAVNKGKELWKITKEIECAGVKERNTLNILDLKSREVFFLGLVPYFKEIRTLINTLVNYEKTHDPPADGTHKIQPILFRQWDQSYQNFVSYVTSSTIF